MLLPLWKYTFFAVLIAVSMQDALAVSRCTVNGQTVFQDSPCQGSLGTHAEEFNKRARQQELENERYLQGSLAESSMGAEERSQRAGRSEAAAIKAVIDRMIDPKSADLRNIKTYAGVGFHKVFTKNVVGPPVIDVVCGEVNSKNRMGGYVGFKPFYWTSHNNTVVMAGSDKLEDVMNSVINQTCTGLRK